MQINPHTTLLEGARFIPSPHHNDRPDPADVSLIVVHGISLPPGQFGTGDIEKFFCGQLDFSTHPYFTTIAELKVSAHLLINRSGKITQFVPFAKRAWHAGKSSFQGRENCNDFSIGIELEGTDELLYEKVQYHSLAKVITSLMKFYPVITPERTVGHSDIAPGRKTDPGPSFAWNELKDLIAL